MKKKSLIYLLSGLVLSITLVGCKDKTKKPEEPVVPKPTITSVALLEQPTKLEFRYGEDVTLAGAKAKVSFSDDTTQDVDIIDSMWDNSISFDTLGQYTIAVNIEINGSMGSTSIVITIIEPQQAVSYRELIKDYANQWIFLDEDNIDTVKGYLTTNYNALSSVAKSCVEEEYNNLVTLYKDYYKTLLSDLVGESYDKEFNLFDYDDQGKSELNGIIASNNNEIALANVENVKSIYQANRVKLSNVKTEVENKIESSKIELSNYISRLNQSDYTIENYNSVTQLYNSFLTDVLSCQYATNVDDLKNIALNNIRAVPTIASQAIVDMIDQLPEYGDMVKENLESYKLMLSTIETAMNEATEDDVLYRISNKNKFIQFPYDLENFIVDVEVERATSIIENAVLESDLSGPEWTIVSGMIEDALYAIECAEEIEDIPAAAANYIAALKEITLNPSRVTDIRTLFEGLPASVESITLEHETTIIEIRTKYNALNSEYLEYLLEDIYSTFVEYEAKIESLKA